MANRLTGTQRQRGAVTTTAITLVIGLITASLWYSVLQLDILNQQTQHQRLYITQLANANQTIATVAAQLHNLNTLSDSQLKNVTVDEHTFINTNGAEVGVYTLSTDLQHHTVNVTQQFVRYPALLTRPAADSTPINNTPAYFSMLDVFNRTVSDFTPSYFTDVHETVTCEIPNAAQVVWQEGDCELRLGTNIGTVDEPILLIVKNGDLHLSGEGTLWGVMLLVSSQPNSSFSILLEPPVSVNGGIFSNRPSTLLIKGELTFDNDLIKTLQGASALQKVIPIPGSWNVAM